MFLNRCAIVLTPKAPYITWADSLDDHGPRYADMPDDEGEPVFLGPDCDTIADVHTFVLKNFDYFFEHYLEQWCTDESLWPQRRTRKLFRAWFDVRIHSMVEDVVDAPLELDP